MAEIKLHNYKSNEHGDYSAILNTEQVEREVGFDLHVCPACKQKPLIVEFGNDKRVSAPHHDIMCRAGFIDTPDIEYRSHATCDVMPRLVGSLDSLKKICKRWNDIFPA